MRFVWDDSKRQRDLEIHRMDFEDVYEFDWERAQVTPTYPSRTGRPRLIATGVAAWGSRHHRLFALGHRRLLGDQHA
jgi:uncharacterized DUF497 family protein